MGRAMGGAMGGGSVVVASVRVRTVALTRGWVRLVEIQHQTNIIHIPKQHFI